MDLWVLGILVASLLVLLVLVVTMDVREADETPPDFSGVEIASQEYGGFQVAEDETEGLVARGYEPRPTEDYGGAPTADMKAEALAEETSNETIIAIQRVYEI
ncbi:MAG: hypothetical protein JXB14_03355 [Candidatus Altiarchaeota archaeon]|nr:hypothetical protein [Candidatus Altiarchaeota archaeon]